MLERADRDDRVVRLSGLVVQPALDADLDPGRPGGFDPARLLPAQGQTDGATHSMSRGQAREQRPPATADIENPAGTGRVRAPGVEVELADLRGLEIVRIPPHRARVGEGAIEPEAVELVAYVVVVPDRTDRGAAVALFHG
jgi:hypothetical protein